MSQGLQITSKLKSYEYAHQVSIQQATLFYQQKNKNKALYHFKIAKTLENHIKRLYEIQLQLTNSLHALEMADLNVSVLKSLNQTLLVLKPLLKKSSPEEADRLCVELGSMLEDVDEVNTILSQPDPTHDVDESELESELEMIMNKSPQISLTSTSHDETTLYSWPGVPNNVVKQSSATYLVSRV